MEAILLEQSKGHHGCMVEVNSQMGGLVLLHPGRTEHKVLYGRKV